MRQTRISYIGKIVFITFVVFMMANHAWAQNHDLVMRTAPSITSLTNGVNWKSLDLKIGTDFGDPAMPDIVQRGVPNSIYARFYINGIEDFEVASAGVEISFYYRNASIGDTPPPLSHSSWNPITPALSATYTPADGIFGITKTWPTDFPSVTTKSVSWTPPPSGNHFHIAAEVDYTTGFTDENPVDNVAISLYESRAGLASIVLLHDTSGSMGTYMCAGSTYMELAKSKASTFVLSSMRDADHLAVVAFSSDYVNDTTVVWPPSAMLEQATWANRTSASAAITGLSASGWTPMGAGLQRAIQILTASPDPDRKKIIILLSDGEENWGTPRACGGSNPAAPCAGEGILGQLQANNIRVYSTALGIAAWTQCLECLATQTEGKWYSTPCPGIALSEIYLHIGQDYSADDLYRVDRGVTGGGDDIYSTYFEGVDNILYFILSWNALDAHLDLQLLPPGLSWSSPEGLSNALVSRGDGYVVVRVAGPAKGTWEYRVTGVAGVAAVAADYAAEEYLVAVRSDRVGVRLEMDVMSEREVGEPITIQARLADGEKPIEYANLTATVQVPVNASFETNLRRESRNYIMEHKASPVDPSVLEENPDISPRAAFIHKIADGGRKILAETRSITIPLQHEGNGVYSGVLEDNTTIAGVYKVTVKAGEERFHRTQSRRIRLRPGVIVHEKSFAEILEIKPEGQESSWLLRAYPVDRFDNAIDELSIIDQIKAEVKGAKLVGKPEIAFDSTFQQQLTVSRGQKPELQMMKIGDKEVKVIKVVKEDSGKPWWKYGVVTFVALVVGFLVGLGTQS